MAQLSSAQELWAGGTFDINLRKSLYFELESQVRSDNGLATYNGYYGEAGMGLKINKFLKVKASYRYTNKAGHHDSEIRPTNNRERISGDLILDFGKTISFKYRIRYHYARERNTYKEYNFIRNKITLKYKLHEIAEPFIESEIFYRFDNKNELRAYRYTIGLDTKISNNLSLENFFRVEKEMNISYPEEYYIFGIMFSYEL